MSDIKEPEPSAATALAIIGVADGIITLLNHLNTLRNQARERGELTPEQDAELDAKLEQIFASPAWQQSGRQT